MKEWRVIRYVCPMWCAIWYPVCRPLSLITAAPFKGSQVPAIVDIPVKPHKAWVVHISILVKCDLTKRRKNNVFKPMTIVDKIYREHSEIIFFSLYLVNRNQTIVSLSLSRKAFYTLLSKLRNRDDSDDYRRRDSFSSATLENISLSSPRLCSLISSSEIRWPNIEIIMSLFIIKIYKKYYIINYYMYINKGCGSSVSRPCNGLWNFETGSSNYRTFAGNTSLFARTFDFSITCL